MWAIGVTEHAGGKRQSEMNKDVLLWRPLVGAAERKRRSYYHYHYYYEKKKPPTSGKLINTGA